MSLFVCDVINQYKLHQDISFLSKATHEYLYRFMSHFAFFERVLCNSQKNSFEVSVSRVA